MSWFVSLRRHERALAAEQAEALRVKKVKDEWWKRHDAVAEELAAVSIVNACLTEELATLKEQLAAFDGRRTVAEVLEEHEAHRQAIADAIGYQDPHLTWERLTAVVAHVAKVAAEWQADHKVEKDRADLAEARLKDAARETDRLNAELAEAREEGGDKSVAHWSAEARREKKRADRLQKQYDDAVGLTGARPQDSSRWQPGYKADAS